MGKQNKRAQLLNNEFMDDMPPPIRIAGWKSLILKKRNYHGI